MDAKRNKKEKEPIAIFRERVEILKKEKGMTQKSFAEYCGLAHSDISNLSRKDQIPSDVMLAIADKCNVSMDWLVGRTDIREVARSKEENENKKEENENKFDYSNVTYGDLHKMLAFAAACGVLRIIPPTDKTGNVTLLVSDGNTGEFLRKLRNKAIDVITDPDETEFLTGWFDKKCADSDRIGFFGVLHGSSLAYLDKYHGAFPWCYVESMNDYFFDFHHAEWRTTDPSDERGYVDDPNCLVDYTPYKNLYDGIVGYYYNSRSFPEPPQKIKKQQESSNLVDDFMHIPDGVDEELPFN